MVIVIITTGFYQRDEKLQTMKMIVIPILADVLGTASIYLERSLEELEICGRIKPIKTTALLRLKGTL